MFFDVGPEFLHHFSARKSFCAYHFSQLCAGCERFHKSGIWFSLTSFFLGRFFSGFFLSHCYLLHMVNRKIILISLYERRIFRGVQAKNYLFSLLIFSKRFLDQSGEAGSLPRESLQIMTAAMMAPTTRTMVATMEAQFSASQECPEK